MGDEDCDCIIQYINCIQLKNHQLVHDDFWVRNGIIINPEILFYVEKLKSHKIVDCKNSLIYPGFIDTQINGYFRYIYFNYIWNEFHL